MEKVLQFLQELSENNNREWFNGNRRKYEESREKILFLTDVFINEIRKFDPEIPPMNPKDCMFRIFRDVRFSQDKRPYKTNFGSFISKGGRKGNWPGYYFHIEPGSSFIGGGIYMPDGGPLKAIRNYVEEHPNELLDILNDPEFKRYFTEMMDHKVKTAPRGIDPDHPHINLLRYKSYAFSSPVDNQLLISDKYIEYAVNAFRELHKANTFLSNALIDF
jgi:uncharacterized protein (TIGR02453 family)